MTVCASMRMFVWMMFYSSNVKISHDLTCSSAQGGCSFAGISFRDFPELSVSYKSSFAEAILGRIRQEVLLHGLLHTVPRQPLSCQGTRMVMWRVGSFRAPSIMQFL